MREIHGPLFEIIETEAKKKYLERDDLRAELTHIRDNWEQIRKAVSPLLLGPDKLLALHKAVAVPTSAGTIGQTRDSVCHTFRHAADVGARFTVLDLAREIGALDQWADEIVTAAKI